MQCVVSETNTDSRHGSGAKGWYHMTLSKLERSSAELFPTLRAEFCQNFACGHAPQSAVFGLQRPVKIRLRKVSPQRSIVLISSIEYNDSPPLAGPTLAAALAKQACTSTLLFRGPVVISIIEAICAEDCSRKEHFRTVLRTKSASGSPAAAVLNS
eukprot:3366779-Pleurochrysis_carterae.AAC.4